MRPHNQQTDSSPVPGKEKKDSQLKTDVLAELQYEPSVKVTDIGVLVKHSVVTLNGYATSYGEKWHAVRATRRVAGIKAIADDIVVRLPDSWARSDGDIAAAVANQIDWSTTIPANAVKVLVSDGWVTLDGEVEWWYQKIGAEDVVRYLVGVKGVKNRITIKTLIKPADIKNSITAAFARSVLLDAQKITVEATEGAVILRGKAHSHAELDEAERVAWAAPGVQSVDNQITLEWHWGLG